MESLFVFKVFVSFALLGLCGVAVHLYTLLWVKPRRLREKLTSQGIGGPKPSFPHGNLVDIKKIQQSTMVIQKGGRHVLDSYLPTLYPYIERWKKDYGSIFTYSTGQRVHLCVTHPDLVKDISSCRSLDLGKPVYLTSELAPILGKHGIIRANGQGWARQRKLLAPEFFMDRVKGMVSLMVESTLTLLESWGKRVGNGIIVDMRVDNDLRGLSADMISKASFGSSYEKGKEIFSMLTALKLLIGRRNFLFGIPDFRYLPTKINREIWRMERNIISSILNVVKERKEAGTTSTSSKDLLTVLIENANASFLTTGAAEQFIVDNCKNFYFAGHDTTAITAMWALILLSTHPEWQSRARAEVLEVCKGESPNVDSLAKLKMASVIAAKLKVGTIDGAKVTMVIQETLRLYPPAVFLARQTFQTMKLGNIEVPEGINVWVPIAALHRDPKIWGPDVDEFKPDRFQNGISGACKVPHAYIPFGAGQRICLGQNFAIVELKIIISLILSRFSFSLSPTYKHSPRVGLLVEPGCEVNLLVEKI